MFALKKIVTMTKKNNEYNKYKFNTIHKKIDETLNVKLYKDEPRMPKITIRTASRLVLH